MKRILMNVRMSKRARIFVFLLLISLVGGLLIYYGTQWGPWTDDDSAEYFAAARNFASGRGLVLVRASGKVRPLSSRPPFYAVLLSIGPLLGINTFIFARFLDILLFSIFLFVLGFIAYRATDHLLLACPILLYFLVSSAFLNIFTSGLAEPLFFVLAISSFSLLISYFQTGRRLLFLISSILAGLSLVTRLAGVAVVGAGIVGLILFGSRRIIQRVKDITVYGLISAVGVVLWFYQVNVMGESAGLYSFDFSNLWDQLAPARVGFVNYGWSLLPYALYLPQPQYRTKLAILLLVGFLFLALLVAALKRKGALGFSRWRQSAYLQIIVAFTTFTLAYVVVFLFSHLFMQIPRALLIQRHLTPVGLGVIVAMFTLIAYLIDSFGWPQRTNFLLIVLMLGLILPNIQPSATLLTRYHEQGYGFSRKRWHNSQLMQAVQELPEDTILISNESEAMLLWINRPAYRVPELWTRLRVEPFTYFGENPDDLVEKIFREQGAALVLFDSVLTQFNAMYGDAAEQRMEAFVDGLFPYAETGDGTLYFYNE
jgi:hypothetical protein